ncbi:MAG TPA: hypothetical protein VI215_01290 [Bacteroidota bacterium]
MKETEETILAQREQEIGFSSVERFFSKGATAVGPAAALMECQCATVRTGIVPQKLSSTSEARILLAMFL